MRNDERLRTIYEVMAPYIVRNEHNWRDYLAFASQFHKHSFDNILLVYAQDEDVSILATRKQWAAITGFSGFLGFHGILHESYVIVAIGIIGLILLITDFIRIKKNNR